MSLFSQIPGAYAVTIKDGVYRQTECFTWQDELYVRHGSGFALLHTENQSSAPKLRWTHIEGVAFMVGRHGRLRVQRAGR
jgi:hypothetical protein